MVLIVTNKGDYTADFLILGLKASGIKFIRFNTEDFPDKVELILAIGGDNPFGRLKIYGDEIELSEIRSVWYRRPFPCKPSEDITEDAAREFIVAEGQAALDGLWRLLNCVWVSHPDKLKIAEAKILQLKMAYDIGFIIPPTIITNSSDAAKDFYYAHHQEVIYKPQRWSKITNEDRVSLIYTNVIDEHHIQQIDAVKYAPSLFQPYISKRVEIRVVVVDQNVFAVELHSQDMPEARQDWRRVNSTKIQHKPHQLPDDVQQKCITMVDAFGLKFSSMDFILTPDNQYVFLELNPNGQWAWIQQTCPEIKIREALIQLLAGATSI